MKLLLLIVGLLAVLCGGVWIAQGMNLLPPGSVLTHSFMMGRREWAIYGVVLVVAGLGAVFVSRRGRRA